MMQVNEILPTMAADGLAIMQESRALAATVLILNIVVNAPKSFNPQLCLQSLVCVNND